MSAGTCMRTPRYNPVTVRKILKAARGRMIRIPDGDLMKYLEAPVRKSAKAPST